VGRGAELAALERELVEVEQGAPRVVGVCGEPGIGKSRLLAELGERSQERGLLVLAGRAAELERDLTFALLLDALEPVLVGAGANALAELDTSQLGELAAVLPARGVLDEVEPAPVSGARPRIARAVRALLERLAAERPLALLLDDVHWADPASVDVLALVLQRPPRGGVLVALAARTGRAPELEAGRSAPS
jgi:predicted ATPase